MRCDIMRTTRYDKNRKQYYTILHCTVLYLSHFDRFEALEGVGGVLDGHVEGGSLRHHLSV